MRNLNQFPSRMIKLSCHPRNSRSNKHILIIKKKTLKSNAVFHRYPGFSGVLSLVKKLAKTDRSFDRKLYMFLVTMSTVNSTLQTTTTSYNKPTMPWPTLHNLGKVKFLYKINSIFQNYRSFHQYCDHEITVLNSDTRLAEELKLIDFENEAGRYKPRTESDPM